MILLENSSLVINAENYEEEISVKADTVNTLVIKHLQSNSALDIDLEEGAVLKISIILDKPLENCKIVANLAKNARIDGYFAEFSNEKDDIDVAINLNAEGATVMWRTACLSSGKDKKNIVINIYHNKPQTYGTVDNYGVCKGESKLTFAGTSHIIKGCSKSVTKQNAKIMVFDPTSDAVAKPILRIDENDIEASHAAAVGKISDEHLFYLTSRGISLDEARTLITLGYLKPIFRGFDEEDVKYIDSLIERKL